MIPSHTVNRKLFLFTVILAIITISSIQYGYAQSLEHVLTFGDGNLNTPKGIAINGTELFVATDSGTIEIWDIDGTFVRQFSTRGPSDDFSNPSGVTTNGTHFFVTTGTFGLNIFDIDGTHVKRFGVSGNGAVGNPNAIATNGTHLFVANTGTHRILIFDFNGNYVAQFAGTGPGHNGLGNGAGEFNFPNGLTINSTHLFVADSENDRVQIFDHTGNYVSQFGSEGTGDGEFDYPRAITTTSAHIFVTDRDNDRVQVFDHDGNYVSQFGSEGNGTGEFDSPNGITTNGTHLYVVDTDNGRVEVLQSSPFVMCTGGQIRDSTNTCVDDTVAPVISVDGSSENRIVTLTVSESYTLPAPSISDNDRNYNQPVTVTINGTSFDVTNPFDTSSAGTFIVTYMASADAANNVPDSVVLTVHVDACPDDQIFNGTVCAVLKLFEHVKTFGSQGVTNGQFDVPREIITNSTHLFVADTENNRIQIFDFNGNYVNSFGSGGSGTGEFDDPNGIVTNGTHIFIADSRNHRIQIFDFNGNHAGQFGESGTGDGQFNRPQAITATNTTLFVADTSNHRIQIFDINGNYTSKFGTGSAGPANGQFSFPRGITTNSTHLFVSDTLNNRVQIFDINGNHVKSFGSEGNGTGQFDRPQGIITNNTHLFIADSLNERIQIFDINGNYVSQFGSDGGSAGQFNDLESIATNSTHLFVADTGNHRIQIFQFVSIEPCTDGQFRDNTGCATDNTPPLIMVDGSSENHTVTLTVSESYTLPAPSISDNDRNYNSTVTVTINEASFDVTNPFNTTSTGTFIVTYMANADAANNVPLPVVLTVIVSCPVNQSFNGTVCAIPEFNHVSTFGSGGNGTGQFNIPVGVATNSTHLFIVDALNHRVQIFDNAGNYVSEFGGPGIGNNARGNDTGEFAVPVGIAINNTHIFITDNANNRVQIFDHTGTYVAQFGGSGDGNGELASPQAITTNSTHIFVADTGNNRVQIFDHNGNYISQFGGTGSADGQFNGTEGIATNNTHIFIADRENHRVQIFDNAGNYVAQFGGSGTGNGEFNKPRDITTTFTHLYVVESDNPRIQVFDINGNYVTEFGGTGSGDGQFAGPRGITTNGTHLYIVDTGNNRAQIFEIPSIFSLESCLDLPVNNRTSCIPDTTRPVITVSDAPALLVGATYSEASANVTDNDPAYSGTISATPSSINTASPGNHTITYTATADAAGNFPLPVEIIVNVSCPDNQFFDGDACTLPQFHHALSFGESGNGDSQFNRPRGITTTDTHIFIVDNFNHRVQIFDNMGNYAGQFGGMGDGNGEFEFPFAITTNSTHLFVVDSNNNRVQIFNDNGEYVGQFGGTGVGDGQFIGPLGITTNNTHLFVTDNSNDRIQIFDTNGNYLAQFGSLGVGNGQFVVPIGITTNKTHLYILDSDLDRVQIFDIMGNYVTEFGGTGSGNGQFDDPLGIATNRTHIFVADEDNHRIQIFDINGNYVDEFGSQGTGNGEFESPSGIATNRTHLFISDGDNNRIQIYQFARLLSCPDDQVSNSTDCITDITPPLITVGGSSENRTVPVFIGESYTIPTGVVTDNDVSYFEIVTFTSTVDTSSVGNFTIRYSAPNDASNNAPLPVVITVNVNACPDGQLFNGTACAIPQFKHVLSFGNTGANSLGASPIGITTDNTNLYIVDTINNKVQIFDNMGNYVREFGGTGPGDNGRGNGAGEFDVPSRIATNNTHLYIADIANHRIQIWDIDGNYVNEFGVSGNGDGEFNRPQGVATNNTHLYISDTGNHRIQIWDINGEYITQFGGTGNGTGEFTSPLGIATNNTHIFVVDNGNNRIQIFDIMGNYTGQFGSMGNGTGEFDSPRAITTTFTHLYVSDANNHRVQVFDFNGTFVEQFGSEGSADGQFNTPRGITTNNTHLYIVDSNNDRAQIFEIPSRFIAELCIDRPVDNRTGCVPDTTLPTITVSDDSRTFLVGATYNAPSATVTDNDPAYSGTIFTTPSTINTTSPGTFTIQYTATADAAGNTPIPVVISVNVSCSDDQFFNGTACTPILEHVLSFGSGPGAGIGQFNKPVGITTNNTHIFVVEFFSHRVQIFDNAGQYVAQFGSRGTADGQFDFPVGIATNNTHIFVVDSGNHRVQIFDINGNYVAQFGGLGSDDGQLTGPLGIATNGTHLYVVDQGNTRMQIFDNAGNYISQFGTHGIGDGEFNQLRAIATNNTHFYISDQSNHRVQIWDIMGNYVSQFGSGGAGNGEFASPVGIATNNTHIFVVDSGNHRVQIFDNAGQYVAQFGSQGNGTGEFNDPAGITTNSTHILISDFNNHRVQVFEFASIVPCVNNEIRTAAGCIVDSEPPLIILPDGLSVTVLQNSTYRPSPSATDNDPNFDGIVNASVIIDPFDTSSEGTFTVTYSAADPSGGSSAIQQTIVIVEQCISRQIPDPAGVICIADTIRPTITVNGTSEDRMISILVGGTYTELAGNVTDNDESYSGTITITPTPGPVDTSMPGNYTITYTATPDDATNIPISVVLTVIVSCPADQIFDGTTCVIIAAEHVLSFGSGPSNGDGEFNLHRGITTNGTHLYVSDTNNGRIQIFDINGTYLSKFGVVDADINGTDGEFASPQGIITNSTHIFVVDQGNHRIQIWDFNGIFVGQFGGGANGTNAGGNGTGEFHSPIGITTNGTHLYITDTDNHRVQIWDINGNYISQFGENGNGTGEFAFPDGITTNNTHLFISDTSNHRIQIWDINGNHVKTFGSSGDTNGKFSFPTGITVSTTHIYVVDTFNHRVQIFDINGNYVAKFGSGGINDGEFNRPEGITINGTHLYIVDTRNSKVEIFALSSDLISCLVDQIRDSTGTCIVDVTPPLITVDGNNANRTVTVTVGESYTVPTGNVTDTVPGYSGTVAVNTTSINTANVGTFFIEYTAPADASGNVPLSVILTINVEACPDGQFFDGTTCVIIAAEHVLSFGSGSSNGDGEFNFPRGITTNGTHLYIADTNNNRVQIFDINGTYLSKFGTGSAGPADGQFNRPNGITVNNTHFFVVDQGNNRVQIWDFNGIFVGKFGGGANGTDVAGNGTGEFRGPQGITTNKTHLFVTDSSNHRIQIWDINGNYISQFGENGNGTGEFASPDGITTNNTHLFISDTGNNRVQIFDINGEYVDQFGSDGSSDGKFSFPAGITVSTTHIYVVDTFNHRVQIFDINGNYVAKFGSAGITDGAFQNPEGITTNGTHLYIVDTRNYKVQIFALSSDLISCLVDQIRDTTGTCIVDVTPPLITIDENSANRTVTLTVDDPYTVLAGNVTDNDSAYSEIVEVNTTSIDTSSAGNFTISYTAPADASGNEPLSVLITVNVVAADTMLPAIALDGANPQIITIGTAYTELGATCTDDTDGTINPIINSTNVDVTTVGSYTVTYDCANAAGNDAPQLTRAVNVVAADTPDTTPPLITVDGSSENRTITLTVGASYTELDGLVNDVDDTSYSGTVTATTTPSPVDTASPGSFNVTYASMDANAAGLVPLPVVLTVNVSCMAGQSFDGTACITPGPSSLFEHVLSFGEPGSENGNFTGPVGITVNSTHLFVVDSGGARIQIFDNDGTFVSTFGSSSGFGNNPANGTFKNPLGITTNNTHIFVADTSNHRVQIFDNSGTYVSQFGRASGGDGRGTGNGQFTSPADITTNGTHLFIVESSGQRVQILDTDGNYVNKFGSRGTVDGQFTTPVGIAINSTHIFVSDTNNHRIQIFDHAGNHVKSFGSVGNGTGEFSFPRGITINGTHLYVVDTNNRRVQVFDHTGNYISQFGASGSADGQFNGPQGITTNDARIFVVDSNNNRIQIFALSSSLPSEPCADGQIRNSTGTCIADTILPVITVDGNGANRTVTVTVGEPYTVPAGAVTDNAQGYSGNVTADTDTIDTSALRNYTITYTASADAAGNVPLSVVLAVNVIAAPPDTTLPTITVDGNSANRTVTTPMGEPYTVPAGAVTDDDDTYSGNVTVNPSTIDTSSAGSFTIRYTAPADAAGNVPLPVVLTVNVECPADQIFNGNACVAILEHVLSFGTSGNSNLQFMHPHGIIINDAHLFIADFSNNRVQVYDVNGNYAYTIGSAGIGDGQFNGLVGLTTNNTHLFVADYDNDRIQVFDINGTYLSQFGETGPANGQFSFPQRIITNSTHLFIADTSNNRVQVYDINGNYAYTIGSAGPGDGQFNRPNGIATNGTHLFIVDTNNHRVQIFDFNGSYVAQFGGTGSANGQLSTPYAITSTDSYILVTDGGNDRIQVFDHAGNYISKFGSFGTADGQFDNPQGITTNVTHVYVSDTSNHRIQVFQLASLMLCPAGQVYDSTGTCVTDTEAPRIIVTPTTVTLSIGQTFTPTVTLSDNDPAYAGTITSTPSSIDTSSAGTFTISYSATADAAGNIPLSVLLTVHVVAASDNTPPAITLTGANIQTITVGIAYTELGATCSDDTDSGLTPSIDSSNVDTNTVGEYTVTYDCADAAGNDAPQLTRTVSVVAAGTPDTTRPVITVGGNSANRTVTLTVGDTYTELAGAVTDNVPGYSGTVSITTTPSAVNTTSPGSFTISYMAPADASGNSPLPIILTVTVSLPTTTEPAPQPKTRTSFGSGGGGGGGGGGGSSGSSASSGICGITKCPTGTSPSPPPSSASPSSTTNDTSTPPADEPVKPTPEPAKPTTPEPVKPTPKPDEPVVKEPPPPKPDEPVVKESPPPKPDEPVVKESPPPKTDTETSGDDFFTVIINWFKSLFG